MAETELHAALGDVRTRVAAIRDRLVDDEAKRSAVNIQAKTVEWQTAWAGFLRLAKSGEYEAAHDILTDKLMPALAALEKDAGHVAERQKIALAELAVAAGARAARSGRITWALLAVTLAINVITLVVVRRATGQLKGMSGHLTCAATTVWPLT